MIIELTESQLSEPLELSPEHVEALIAEADRFNSTAATESSEPVVPALKVEYAGVGRHRIRTGFHIGVVEIEGLTVIIRPKIALNHFAFIAAKAFGVPKSGQEDIRLKEDQTFLELIAIWFLEAARHIIPNRLVSDYRELADRLPMKRGRVNYLPTYRLWMRGNLKFEVTIEEFGLDHPINRVLNQGLRIAAAMTKLDNDRRRLARDLLSAFGELSELRSSDLRVGLDRRNWHYATAFELARCLILGRGRGLEIGRRTSRTFLLETPSLVEAGIRNTLCASIDACEQRPRYEVVHPLGPAKPDLIFRSSRSINVGDVKYKKFNSWGEMRDDLYQSVFFAQAYRTHQSCIIGFVDGAPIELDDVHVGPNTVRGFLWNADSEKDPNQSAQEIVSEVQKWMSQTPEQLESLTV